MVYVLGIVGSPRKEGNTDVLVNEVLRGAQDSGAEVEKVFLNDLKITPCQAICSDYCIKNGICKIDDDMLPLYDKLYSSKVIILGTPIYWYGPSAQLKAFIDRWYAFSSSSQHLHKMEGKKIILVAPFEESTISTADPLVDMLIRSLNYLKSELYEKILVTAGEKGVIRQNTETMKRAYNIGRRLEKLETNTTSL